MDKQRLIGTAESPVSVLAAAKGKPLSFPLSFVAASDKDHKKSSRIPVGSLLLTALCVEDEATQYRLDVQCSRILRAKALSHSYVKRMFYTIHAIVDNEPKSDLWTLLYRSGTVGMIRTKKDGGSLEYNYFSCRRLLAKPGMILDDSEDGSGEGDGGSMSVLERVGAAIGLREAKRFFSLPGGDILVEGNTTRLKLTLFEDKGANAGFDMIADTEFTAKELQQRELGSASPVKMRANVGVIEEVWPREAGVVMVRRMGSAPLRAARAVADSLA
ncbi:hypothetical protein FGB62_7g010 [Gracilaria domingensis]|nr:hypothetical protein FGB62_7g010 [Gracilaria domingensis]